MRDCVNAAMRDLLPDLLHDRLPAERAAEVRSHVAACPDCRAELELLTRARAVARRPAVDAARISAAIPAYRSGVAGPVVRPATWLAIAATILLLMGGLFVTRRAIDRGADVPPQPIASAVPGAPAGDTQVASGTRGAASGAQRRTPATRRDAVAFGVGDLDTDLTDADLRALLAELESIEAMTPLDPEVVVPAFTRSGP